MRTSSFSSEDDRHHGAESEDDIDSSIKFVGTSYPYVKRRKKLPDPAEKEKSVSLWSMIKDNIGKDLTKICLPVYFNEPLSSLQKCFEELEYSYLLDRAYEWGKRVILCNNYIPINLSALRWYMYLILWESWTSFNYCYFVMFLCQVQNV